LNLHKSLKRILFSSAEWGFLQQHKMEFAACGHLKQVKL